MKKNVVKLNENTLRRIVAESVKKVLKEYRGFRDLKNYDNEKYGSEDYMNSYCEKWLNWANVYGTKWANKNNEDVDKVLHAAENYIRAITTEPNGLVDNYMDTSPKRDAYDYFFKDHGIEQSLENERIMGNNLGESKLNKIVTESVKKVLKEMEEPTPYGPMTSGEWKPTFDDPTQQSQLASDTRDMLSKIPQERFVKLYWNRRLTFKDPDTVDAIYKEAIKRGIL